MPGGSESITQDMQGNNEALPRQLHMMIEAASVEPQIQSEAQRESAAKAEDTECVHNLPRYGISKTSNSITHRNEALSRQLHMTIEAQTVEPVINSVAQRESASAASDAETVHHLSQNDVSKIIDLASDKEDDGNEEPMEWPTISHNPICAWGYVEHQQCAMWICDLQSQCSHE
jgi:hypothetical protein